MTSHTSTYGSTEFSLRWTHDKYCFVTACNSCCVVFCLCFFFFFGRHLWCWTKREQSTASAPNVPCSFWGLSIQSEVWPLESQSIHILLLLLLLSPGHGKCAQARGVHVSVEWKQPILSTNPGWVAPLHGRQGCAGAGPCLGPWDLGGDERLNWALEASRMASWRKEHLSWDPSKGCKLATCAPSLADKWVVVELQCLKLFWKHFLVLKVQIYRGWEETWQFQMGGGGDVKKTGVGW